MTSGTDVLGVLPSRVVPVRQRAAADAPAVVGVVGGAGGVAAVVADVDGLGERLAVLAQDLDARSVATLLAAAALDAEPLVVLAPAAALSATDRCVAAAAVATTTALGVEALARAARLAAEAYAGVEAAQTRTWHLASSALLPVSATVLVAAAFCHEGLRTPGTAPLETAALELTLDGVGERVAAAPVGPVAVRPSASTTVTDSGLRRVTATAGSAYGPSESRLALLAGPPVLDPAPEAYEPCSPGLTGLLAGVADTSRAREHVVAVRRRTVSGPAGRREAYVVDLPGTDRWSGPGDDESPMDLGSGLRQLGGATDEAYVEAVLRLLDDAPPGATVVLVGHSLGGITASTVAAVAAARGRRVDYVVTAGSPVDTMTVPQGTTVVALQNDADPVPALDGRRPHDVAGRTTLVVDDDRGRGAAGHEVGAYVGAARAADRFARDDPGLAVTTERMRRDGAIADEDDVVEEEVTWWRVERLPAADRPDADRPRSQGDRGRSVG